MVGLVRLFFNSMCFSAFAKILFCSRDFSNQRLQALRMLEVDVQCMENMLFQSICLNSPCLGKQKKKNPHGGHHRSVEGKEDGWEKTEGKSEKWPPFITGSKMKEERCSANNIFNIYLFTVENHLHVYLQGTMHYNMKN